MRSSIRNRHAAVVVSFLVLVACGDDDPAGGVYGGVVWVDSTRVSARIRDPDRVCCGLFPDFEIGTCDTATDYPPCLGCDTCVDTVELFVNGQFVDTDVPAMWDGTVGFMVDTTSSNSVDLVVQGCHGSLEIPITSPIPHEEVTVSPLTQVEGAWEVTWAPAAGADAVCLHTTYWTRSEACCFDDTGSARTLQDEKPPEVVLTRGWHLDTWSSNGSTIETWQIDLDIVDIP